LYYQAQAAARGKNTLMPGGVLSDRSIVMRCFLFALAFVAGVASGQETPLAKIYGRTITQADIKPGDKDRSLTRLILTEFGAAYVHEHKLEPTEPEIDALRRKFAEAGGASASTGPQADWFTKLLVTSAKLQRTLYKKHGGRVALSAFGAHTAIDATLAELKILERDGRLKFFDAKLRDEVYNEISNTRGDGVVSGKSAAEAINGVP
jgi:hypothetical protein